MAWHGTMWRDFPFPPLFYMFYGIVKIVTNFISFSPSFLHLSTSGQTPITSSAFAFASLDHPPRSCHTLYPFFHSHRPIRVNACDHVTPTPTSPPMPIYILSGIYSRHRHFDVRRIVCCHDCLCVCFDEILTVFILVPSDALFHGCSIANARFETNGFHMTCVRSFHRVCGMYTACVIFFTSKWATNHALLFFDHELRLGWNSHECYLARESKSESVDEIR